MNDVIHETEVAKRLGVNRNTLLDHSENDLVKNLNWKKNGRAIYYTTEGVDQLINLIGVSITENQKKAVSEPPAPEKPRQMTVYVKRHNFPNPKALLAETSTGDEVGVRVKDNKNFRVIDYRGERMALEVVPDGAGWALSRPVPRWPGKW